MLTGSCHCGAVRIEVPDAPPALIDCNCSICRRNGALWAIYPDGAARVVARPADLMAYVWGRGTIRTLRCAHCGCVTHWDSVAPDGGRGVNFRNFDPTVIAATRIRRFDGAESWTYLDD